MPVGNNAAPELMPTVEQRKYIINRIREVRSPKSDIEFFPMDFQNDGEYVGGCYIDRAIKDAGVDIALAAMIGVDYAGDDDDPVEISANKAGDEESIEVSVNYDERSGYYTLNEFAEKFGE